MAQTWQRLAEEQDHATDLRRKEKNRPSNRGHTTELDFSAFSRSQSFGRHRRASRARTVQYWTFMRR